MYQMFYIIIFFQFLQFQTLTLTLWTNTIVILAQQVPNIYQISSVIFAPSQEKTVVKGKIQNNYDHINM